jgi:DNA-directed RNA polymerase specialized sigma24 family protein
VDWIVTLTPGAAADPIAALARPPAGASIVELRFYGGCTIADTAIALEVSTATVEREWRTAKAWLYGELS